VGAAVAGGSHGMARRTVQVDDIAAAVNVSPKVLCRSVEFLNRAEHSGAGLRLIAVSGRAKVAAAGAAGMHKERLRPGLLLSDNKASAAGGLNCRHRLGAL